MSNDIQYYKNIIRLSESNAPNFDKIAKHLKIGGSNWEGMVIDFKLLLNDKINTEDGLHIDIHDLEMSTKLYYRSGQENETIIGLPLFVWYDASDDEHYGDEDLSTERVEDWFYDGNYHSRLQQHLLAAGFSQNAVSNITIDALYSDNIEYDAPGIANEITQALGVLLQGDFSTIMQKYGVGILAANIKFTPDEIKFYKSHIIRYMLKIYKDKGVTRQLTQILNNLLAAGLDWPELTVIKRSVDSH